MNITSHGAAIFAIAFPQFHGNAMEVPWQSQGRAMAVAWPCHGFAMAAPWQYHHSAMLP